MFAAILFVCIPDWCGFISPHINLYPTEQNCVVETSRLVEDVRKNTPTAKIAATCFKVKAESI